MSERIPLRIIMVQATQLPLDASSDIFATFEESVRNAVAQAPTPQDPDAVTMVVFPEMHLFGTPGLSEEAAHEAQNAAACSLPQEGTPDPPLAARLTTRLSELARDLGIWLVPGTLCERAATEQQGIYNTAAVWNPAGEFVAAYRKICPWRPYETYIPGDSFTVFDIPGVGRVGFTICYDAWFPEISRQVAWKGAELILNLVRTTTPDRAQELVLAQSNAIVNQSFVASLNAAGPDGYGRSLLVDPNGTVINELPTKEPGIITAEIDLGQAKNVRDHGTVGLNRVWHQFKDSDPTIPLPLYGGSITAQRWKPSEFTATATATAGNATAAATTTTQTPETVGKK